MRRVLHTLTWMNRGGVETWLMHVLRNCDRSRIQMDFMVRSDQQGDFDHEIRELGSNIIYCPLTPSRIFSDFSRQFKRVITRYGPYDVVHSHLRAYSGWILYLAHQAGVSGRIAHSHNDISRLRTSDSLLQRLYMQPNVALINRHATSLLACSEVAGIGLFGPSWPHDPRAEVIPYGVDLEPFSEDVDQDLVRAELGIPTDAFVVGHVGRFYPQKNHLFLLEIAREILTREPRMHLLLVGDGPLRSDIEKRAHELGLSDNLTMTGVRSDIPRVMKGAMNVFLFPSKFEGLGIVLIEAQASGLPCVFSDVVPDEAEVIPSLVHRMELSQSSAKWAEKVMLAYGVDGMCQTVSYHTMMQSPYNITTSAANLLKLYDV